MKKLLFLFGALLHLNLVHADALSDKIKVGLTKDAVIALFGANPDTESCKTTLGLTSCNLTWTKGIFSKDIYEVTFIADRVIAVSSTTKKLLGGS